MPRRTGQPTLTDERRKWDAKRLYVHYSSSRPQPSVKSWRNAFPRSTANDNSARAMCGSRMRWFRENFPDELQKFDEELTRAAGLPYGAKMTLPGYKPLRRLPPRGRTEREKRTIRRATSIIITYCVFRFPLEECWSIAVPESTANPNSARILAQRKANNFIRKYPGAAQVVLENFVRKASARLAGRRRPPSPPRE